MPLLRRPDSESGEDVARPVTLVVKPTTCEATFAMLMSCGHIQFGCSDDGGGPLRAALHRLHKETVACALCVVPAGRAQRGIEWIWVEM